MREYIQYLQETQSGSNRPLSDENLDELCGWLEKQGYYIVMDGNRLTLAQDADAHELPSVITERDAVRLFKMVQPNTFSRKTPMDERFPPPKNPRRPKGRSGHQSRRDRWK